MSENKPGLIVFIIIGIAVMVGLYAMKGVEIHNRNVERTLQDMKYENAKQEWERREAELKRAKEGLTHAVAQLEKDSVLAVQNMSDPQRYKGHGYVDLGLSVKWAACNVGATEPEERGVSFTWGDAEPQSVFDGTYKWSLSRNGLSRGSIAKYNTMDFMGRVDGLTVLLPKDDVASVRWGGKWRMPTKEEAKELLDNCDWQWTVVGDTNVCLGTSKVNGNRISLPLGMYWSSSLYTDYPINACCLSFESDTLVVSRYHRAEGLVVRPVFD